MVFETMCSNAAIDAASERKSERDLVQTNTTVTRDSNSPEEIPELVRVFFSGHGNNSNNGFEYRAATELLKKNPKQVRYVTYECKTRNDCSANPMPNDHGKDRSDDGTSNSHRETETETKKTATTLTSLRSRGPFLHSPLRWACIETTREAEAMEFLVAIRSLDPTQFLVQDSQGDLPIDGECVLNASLELLSFLLKIYLDYDFVCPNGVGMTEANFNPITCLCGSYWWEDIHQACDRIASGEYIVSGNSVLEDNLGIEDQFWKKIILLTKAFYHKTIEEDYTTTPAYDDEHPNKENHAHTNDECEETENPTSNSQSSSPSPSMLRITNEFGDRSVEFRLLHACAGIDWFPPNLLRLLVSAFPECLLEADEDGNIPIHVASGCFFESYKMYHNDGDADNDADISTTTNNYNTIHEDSSWEELFEANSGCQKMTIDIFLEANPNLAKIPDAEGRLPLELAIENNSLDDDATVFYDDHHNKVDLHLHLHSPCKLKRWRPWEGGGIGSLLKAYPEAARIRSPITGKLPLEITLGRGSCRDWEDGIEALLNAYPEAASQENPFTGKCPLQLAIERETHFDAGVYGLLKASPQATAWNLNTNTNTNTNTSNRNGNAASKTKQMAMLPLFALAASENCSASVVYKILRTNPDSCSRSFDFDAKVTATVTTKRDLHQRKRRQPHEELGEGGRRERKHCRRECN